MGGGDQANVDGLVMNVSHTAKYAVFQHLQQLGLDLKVDFPISSRNTVPRSATSSRPCLALTALVNAPLACPKSSDSSSSRESPAQFRSRKASSARGPLRCIQLASTPLPDPVSPCSRTGLSLLSTRLARSSSWRMATLFPRKGSTHSRFVREMETSDDWRYRRFVRVRNNTACRADK